MFLKFSKSLSYKNLETNSCHRLKKLTRLVFFTGLIFLFSGLDFETEAGTWRFASPQKSLFQPLLADPTETQFAITTNFVNRLNGDIGGSWEAFDYEGNQNVRLRFRTGIHAGVFSQLRWSGTFFPLETSDYIIGFHADLATNQFSGRFEYEHLSAHLVDGHDDPSQAFTYSREYFTIYGDYKIGLNQSTTRIYSSLQWSNHAIPNIRRWQAQFGAELISYPLKILNARPYLAYDIRLFRNKGLVANSTAHIGMMLRNEESRGLRIALVLHLGRSEHGQFHQMEDNYLGLGMFFEL